MESTLKEKFVDILDECGGINELKEAFDEFIEYEVIKVGNTVRVIDWGKNYPSCEDWFIKNNIPRNLCVRYAYNRKMAGCHIYEDSDAFEVLVVLGKMALITPIDKMYDNSCYLIDINGLENVE